jgi:hypothetical protein
VSTRYREILVSEQPHKPDLHQLERITDELNASLRSCRAILRDCRQKLAANSNEPERELAGERAELLQP